MHIQFKSRNFDLPANVTQYATRKLETLNKHLGSKGREAYAHVTLGRETTAHQAGRIWIMSVELRTDEGTVAASTVEESIEKAIDVATAELRSELSTLRTRSNHLMKKGGRAVKTFLRGSFA